MSTEDISQIREDLYTRFKIGNTPTEDDFKELIDRATDASALTAGTLSNDRLSETLETKAYQGETATLTGHLQAKTLEGDGSKLKNLNATEITSGTLSNSRLEPTVETTAFKGKGTELTELDASKLTLGTLSNERLPSTIDIEAFKGDGSGITNLTADNISSGTLSNEHLPRTIDLKSISKSDSDASDKSSLTADVLSASSATFDELSVDTTDCFGDKKILVKNLPDASANSRGIVRFASEKDIEDGLENRAVTSKSLNAAIATNKAYVDKEVELLQAGVKFKKGVKTVISEQIDLSSAQAFPLVDGYQIQEGDRVLLVGQEQDKSQNRVWVASENNTWVLAEDFDSELEEAFFIGLSVEVLEGNEQQHSIWTVIDLQQPDNPELSWQKRNDINNYKAGSGIKIDGLTISASLNSTDLPIEELKAQLSLFGEDGLVDPNSLPQASSEKAGVITLASSAEITGGTDTSKAITPKALKDSNIIDHIFHFAEDTGQDISIEDIPEGKILVLYVDA